MSIKFDGVSIARATNGRLITDGPAGPIWTDTRSLPRGAWFVVLKGDRFDGHDFLATAAERGAAGCVVEREGLAWTGGMVVVQDGLRALQDLGRAARDLFHGPVVGLTGSSGKTTTRALISLAISPLGVVHQTTGNLNNHIGVPLTLLDRPDDAAAMVVEMGTSGPGEIAVLADIARPEIRLIVNVGPAHLLELGGLDGVAQEKGALFSSARAGDTICVNLDDSRVAALPVPAGVRVIGWSAASGKATGEIVLRDAIIDPKTLTTDANFDTPMGKVNVRIPTPGQHIAHNAAGALCVALALGIDLREAAAAMARYEPVGMRLREESLPGGGRALNDAYNANPSSMAASLRLVASLPGRRAVVLGDMLELGPQEADWHAQTATLAHELMFDRVFLVGPRMAAAAAHCPGCAAFADPEHAVEPLLDWLASGGGDDVVLFKGSRGARVERVLALVRGSPVGGH